MVGMLTYGAVAGGAGEYLKQGDEKRAAKYQEIRDKRIGEIRKGNITHEYGLRSEENVRAEGVASKEKEKERGFTSKESEKDRQNQRDIEANKPITLGRGQEAYGRDGSLIASGPEYTHAPNASSVAADKWNSMKVYRRGADGKRGAATTYEELTKEWEAKAYIDTKGVDEYGNPVTIKKRNPSVPDLTDYQNQNVTDEFQLEPNDPIRLQRDPGRLWKFYQSQPEFSQPGGQEQAIQAMQTLHPWWQPESEGDPLDDPRNPSPGPADPNPAAGVGQPGMLDPTQQKAAAAAAATVPAAGGGGSTGMMTQGTTAPVTGQMARTGATRNVPPEEPFVPGPGTGQMTRNR